MKLREDLRERMHPPRIDDELELILDINRVLDDHAASANLFYGWRGFDRASRERLHQYIWDDLVATRQYREALIFEEVIRHAMSSLVRSLPEGRASGDGDIHEQAYTNSVALYVSALFGVGRTADAVEAIRKWMSVLQREPNTKTFCELVDQVGALMGGESRAKAFDAIEESFPEQTCTQGRLSGASGS